MELKKCCYCLVEKEITQFKSYNRFYKGEFKSVRHISYCNECKKLYSKNYFNKNKEKLKYNNSKYYFNNKEKLSIKAKIYRYKNKDDISKRKKEALKNNKEKINALSRESYHRNKNKKPKKPISEKKKKYMEIWRKNNVEKIRLQRNNYYKKRYSSDPDYRKQILKMNNKTKKNKLKSNPIYKLKDSLRRYISFKLNQKGFNKNKRTSDILGIDMVNFKKHIERQFKKGMTWSNRGVFGWHIDHIIPLSSAKTKEDMIKLCHYTNLQPLWAKDNLKKHSKIPKIQMKLTI